MRIKFRWFNGGYSPKRAVLMLSAWCALAGLFSTLGAVSAPGEAAAAPSATSRFQPTGPSRVLDTRSGPKVAAGQYVSVPLAGIPANATAVVLNVTVTEPEAVGYITAYSGSIIPATSNANVDEVGETAANLVIVATNGPLDVRVFSSMNTHLLVDLLGWFEPPGSSNAGRYRAVPSATSRILDTRDESTTQVSWATPRVLPIRGRAGVPATGVQAVALNVTVTDSAGAGWLQAYDTGGTTAAGASSNVNINGSGQTVANLVIVPVGNDGSVTLVGNVVGHVLVDVAGWFTDASAAPGQDGLFVAVDPTRLADSRQPLGSAPIQPGTTMPVSAAVAGVDASQIGAALANLTLAETGGAGYVTGYTGTGDVPQASTINADKANATVANAGIIATSGTNFGLYSSLSAHLVVDLLGWFTRSAGSPPPLDPNGPGSVVSSTPSGGGQLIRYRSIGAAGQLQEQITMAHLPTTPRPAGGWPVMALVHGPWGMSDQHCVVSSSSADGPLREALPWLNAGYAVVFPNLEGLGMPGLHPYLNGPGTGRSVLDAVRAARTVYGSENLSNKVGSWGYSSGAHGALWVGEMAPTYAPELDMRGVISLDPVSVVSSYLDGLWQQRGAFSVWISLGATVANPNLRYEQVMKQGTIDLLPQLENSCLNYQLFDNVDGEQGPLHTNPMTIPAWADTIEASNPGYRPSAPVWLAGGNDFSADIPALPHAMHNEYMDHAKASGTSVLFRIFDGGHTVMETQPVLDESLAWMNSQMG